MSDQNYGKKFNQSSLSNARRCYPDNVRIISLIWLNCTLFNHLKINQSKIYSTPIFHKAFNGDKFFYKRFKSIMRPICLHLGEERVSVKNLFLSKI